MSGKNVDERTVEMKFDNKNFESNVQTSLSTIDKLKKSLDFKGATKGLEGIQKASSKVDMSGLSSAVENIKLRFSALQVMAVTALANITNSAITAGERIVSALTLDPIKTGFQEYETQINAIQTILANTESKGTTLNQVNAALNELNTYADKTIYNFTEMTKNIGTFTAAGVDLNTSVEAIKGIANLAAVSGSNAQQASTAMYQLSQALASGTVKLMDWNSVVNAGMGGQVFQDSLKETARLHGVAIDQMIKDEGSFRETLQEGWLTSDILTETLSKFTGDLNASQLRTMGYTEDQITSILKLGQTANDAATKVKTFTQLFDTLKEAMQSGWTNTWELIIGDFGESKELLTSMSNSIGSVIQASAKARNNLVSGGLSSGWKQLLNAGISDEAGYIESVQNVAKEHGIAIDDMIKKEGSFTETLKSGWLTSDIMSEALQNFTDKTKGLSDDQLTELGYTRDQIDALDTLNEKVQNGSISLEEFAEKMKLPSGRQNLIDALYNSCKGLISILKPIHEAFREVFPKMTGDQLYSFTEKIKDLTAGFKISKKTASDIKNTFSGLFTIVSALISVIVFVIGTAGKVISALSPVFSLILSMTGAIGKLITNTLSIGGALKTISNVIVGVFTFIGDVFKLIANGVDYLLDALGKININNSLSGVNKFTDILAKAFDPGVITSFAAAFASFSIFKFLDKITTLLKNFTKSVDVLNTLKKSASDVLGSVTDQLKAMTANVHADTLLKIAIAIGILAISLKVLEGIDATSLASTMTVLATGMATMLASLKYIIAISPKKYAGIVFMAGSIRTLAIALLILAIAIKMLSGLNVKELAIGLSGIVVGLAALTTAFKILSKDVVRMYGTAISMVIIATALVILAKAILMLSGVNIKSMATSLGALVIGLAAFVGAIALLNKIDPVGMISTSISIGIMATALVILATAILILSKLNIKELATSLGALIIGLAAFVGAIALLNKIDAGGMISTSISIGIMAASLIILAKAILMLSGLNIKELGTSLGALVVGLAALVGASVLLSKYTKSLLTTGVGFLAVAIGIRVLASALKVMTSLDPKKTAVGIAAIAITLLILAGAIEILGANALLMPVIGIGLIAVSAGIILLAAGLKAIADLPLKSIIISLGAVLVALLGFGLIGTYFGLGIIALAAAFALVGIGIGLAGKGIYAFAAGITMLAAITSESIDTIIENFSKLLLIFPLVGKGLADLIIAFIQDLADSAVSLASSLFVMVDMLLQELVKYTPKIVDYLMTFIIGVLNGVAARMPELVGAISNLVSSLFNAIFDSLGKMDSSTIINILLGIGLIATLLIALNAITGLIPGAMLGLLGLAGIVLEIGLILAAFGGLSKIPGLMWLISEGGNFLQALGTAIGQFIGGIAGGIASGFSDSLPKIADDLSDFMNRIKPFIEGASSIDASTLEGVKTLAQVILLLTSGSILNSISSWLSGGSSLSDFANQLVPFGQAMKRYSEVVSGIDAAAISASATAAKALVKLAKDIPDSKGFKTLLTGDNDIGDFGQKLVPFGRGLKAYSTSVSGIDSNAIKSSATAFKSLVSVAKDIPDSEGVKTLLTGDNDIGDFGQKLVPFGRDLKAYSTSVSGIDTSSITTSVAAVKSLVSMIKSMAGLDTSGVSSFSSSIKTLSKTSVKGFTNAFSNTDLSSVGSSMVSSLNKGLKSGSSSLKSTASSIASSLSKAFSSQKGTMTSAGKDLVSNLAKGITSGKSKITSASKNTVSGSVSSIREYHTTFYNAGAYLAAGVSSGIRSKIPSVKAATAALANAAKTSFTVVLKIHSPSKVFDEYGQYTGQGFVNGLLSLMSNVKNAAATVANKATNGLKSAISNISSLLGDGIDSQPTIKPVLDLSNIETGRNALDNMLNFDSNIGVLSTARKINNSMNQMTQNGNNDDVVSSINKLRSDLNNNKGDQYNLNGVTYDDGSAISGAVKTIIRTAKIERRR